MPRDVPSKHEVHAALERSAQLLKRQQREAREILATLRHSQAHLLGIDVETITTHSSQGEQSDASSQEAVS